MRAALTVFLVVMTNFILLIGAGLFSRSIWSFQSHAFNTLYVPVLLSSHTPNHTLKLKLKLRL